MKEIEYKFKGSGEFVPGVPMRDLVKGEAESRGILELVKASPLYEKVSPKKKIKKDEK